MPFPSPGDLPDPGMEPGYPTLQADSLPFESTGKPVNLLPNLQMLSLAQLELGPTPDPIHGVHSWGQRRTGIATG